MGTILVVDDHPMVIRMVRLQLEREGFAVVEAREGAEALERLADTKIDLLLTDYAMPGMDGLALVRRLRADPRHRDLPIILLTASGDFAVSTLASDEGVDGFLTKPTSTRELLGEVRRLLG